MECSRLNAQNRVQTGEENLVVKSGKSGRKMQQKKNRKVVIACPERREYRFQCITKRSQCCVLLDWLTEKDC